MAGSIAQSDFSSKPMIVKVLAYIWSFRAVLIVLLTPLMLTLLFAVTEPSKQIKCLYTVLVMAVYWITEVLPLPVTALLPLVMYPLLGVVKSANVAKTFMTDALFLFMGGFFIAIALEKSQLHKRLALGTLLIFGSDPRKILMALMSSTAFLSMWISNAAATGMMLPIIQAILIELIKGMRSPKDDLEKVRLEKSTKENVRLLDAHNNTENYLNKVTSNITDGNELELKSVINNPKQDPGEGKAASATNQSSPDEGSSEIQLTPESLSREEANLCKMFLICACYASSVGGVGTLTGTPPNIIVYGYIEKTYGRRTGLTYLSWLLYAVPIVILNVFASCILLIVYFLGFKRLFKATASRGNVKAVIRAQYDALGPMSYQECTVAILFCLLIVLWVFHSPQFIKGWGDLFLPGYVSGATPAIFIACLMFVLPCYPPDISCDCRSGKLRKIQPPLMTWKYLQSKFPWDMVILIGGSFGMAEGISVSGLSTDIGNYMSKLDFLSPWQLCCVTILLASAATEFTSNAAMSTILTPILCSVAVQLKVNPLYLALTEAVGVSYAFMLPIGTPANAIVFAVGLVTVIDMVKVGFFMNIITALVTILASNTWGWWMFDFSHFPDWAKATTSAQDAANATQFIDATLSVILSNLTT